MNDSAWAALERRSTWVVGKGGVGKSTTACAIAQRASTQQTVHSISLDPAHSIRDILGDDAPAQLTVEELDAQAYADAWLARVREAIVEVVEQGTYLDADDTRTFLDLSFPGVDEVMAAFRLAEIVQGPAARIVIDTAPTGHTLRLLDAGKVLESWADALEAMLAKADAVAIALVGAAPQRPAHRFIEEWRETSKTFTGLQHNADFVVVTRAGIVVEAETERLIVALRQRGITRITVHTIEDRVPDDPPVHHDRGARHEPGHSILDVSSSILLVAGKGGVGKSTVAAALGLLRAQLHDTCLISTDPAGSLSEVLQRPVGATPVDIAGAALIQRPGGAALLRVWQLDADRAYREMRDEYAGEVRNVFEQMGLDQSAALDREVIERLWNLAPPGLDEIVALTELLSAAETCESLVLDSAPTGHFLRLIAMPQIGVEWAHSLLRTLMKYQIAGRLECFSREVLQFAQRARGLQNDLTTGRAAAVLVGLDHPVVWAETERLHAALTAAQIPVAALVINRADNGPRSGYPLFTRQLRVFRAPNLASPPIGIEGLRDFIRSWELL